MSVWVGLLRAINVGRRRVKMADLRTACEQLGFTTARTYIASGNVVLAGPTTEARQVQRTLEAGLTQRLGFDVQAVVRTPAQLHAVVAGLPFASPEQVNVMFLLAEPDPVSVPELRAGLINDAELVVDGLHAYLRTPHGLGQPFLSGPVGSRFALAGTMRTWRTTVTLARMADELAGPTTS